ncbi:glucose-6-phosphate isomerase [Marinobacter persicus]|uniref:Glucose-6-phosphate isomerase n=1 Tax=Marinobacter persicus TaxID=930118 RepID=A0A2S6G2G5_9GAMM|nr:glucose-6-phosphate isomerase [Marinobacter persicus]PPK49986.1 glucose-6-phosphate isomerase [Marinobacter persicus]PPK51901.1 glucose-6-phosphate isomerase [Marinobacter persicus]PPK56568.1 glucose-6-phosphate isomerase [Marinobacter persicus]
MHKLYATNRQLELQAQNLRRQTLSELLCGADKSVRAERLQFYFDSIHLDASKQRLTEETLELLLEWALQCGVEKQRDDLFGGKALNTSENRAALHFSARWPINASAPQSIFGTVKFCAEQRQKMAHLVQQIHSGKWRGVTGEPITDIVHIGVGGSDLGPKLVSETLGDAGERRITSAHYVSTMDGSQLLPLMQTLNPATTLLVLASKSFSTVDTQFNVRTALAWLSEQLSISTEELRKHQVLGVSARPERMDAFGIPESHQLQFPETIGGRFSVWSAIGVSVALELGMETFETLLSGAHAMDQHFQKAPSAQNLPILLGIIGAWNTQFLKIPTHLVLPYDGRLNKLPPYLQQLEMESNGKTVRAGSSQASQVTCPIIWGDIGPNAQHAFYQLVHQGSHEVSADFIAVAKRTTNASCSVSEHLVAQTKLTLANCIAQSQLFALGDDAITGNLAATTDKGYRGNQPNTVIILETLDAWSLGALLALYEHKVFVQSILWGINPFDQPGVELGKKLSTSLYQVFSGNRTASEVFSGDLVDDSSTRLLVERVLLMARN